MLDDAEEPLPMVVNPTENTNPHHTSDWSNVRLLLCSASETLCCKDTSEINNAN